MINAISQKSILGHNCTQYRYYIIMLPSTKLTLYPAIFVDRAKNKQNTFVSTLNITLAVVLLY